MDLKAGRPQSLNLDLFGGGMSQHQGITPLITLNRLR